MGRKSNSGFRHAKWQMANGHDDQSTYNGSTNISSVDSTVNTIASRLFVYRLEFPLIIEFRHALFNPAQWHDIQSVTCCLNHHLPRKLIKVGFQKIILKQRQRVELNVAGGDEAVIGLCDE